MGVIHYDPFEDSDSDKAWCGTVLGEDYNSSNDERYITCKRCEKALPKIKAELQNINEHRNNEDAGFLEFMKSEYPEL